MKKGERINQIFDELIQYAHEMKLPYIEQIEEMRNQYELKNIIGLMENFLKEPYDKEELDTYFDSEVEKYNQLGYLFGFPKIEFNPEQKIYIVNKFEDICKLIFC